APRPVELAEVPGVLPRPPEDPVALDLGDARVRVPAVGQRAKAGVDWGVGHRGSLTAALWEIKRRRRSGSTWPTSPVPPSTATPRSTSASSAAASAACPAPGGWRATGCAPCCSRAAPARRAPAAATAGV